MAKVGTKRALHERSPPGLDIIPASQRRRLSFSNSDLSDPRQLQVLYERCLDQVLRGIHPVSRDTAIRLAAIQCFVQFGPYRDGIQSSIRAYNLLPKEYVHAHEHEKNIAEQYRNFVFPDEEAARRKYSEICKNLTTYGMIFFEVKEPDGNKLVPRLFGVNKDCVMSVDKKTKVVRKSWPLEQLRRWAASPYTFNIDFGDYQDGYYSVQTPEGEKIKRLIAEFVDIILIRKQIVDPFGLEGDEGGLMIEDYVHRARSVPLTLEDVQQRRLRMGSSPPPRDMVDLEQLLPLEKPVAAAEPRSPFMPLENQFPEIFQPQQPQQRPSQPPPAVPVPHVQAPPAHGFPRSSAPPPLGTPVTPPFAAHHPPPEHYDQLPFQMVQQSPSPPEQAMPQMPMQPPPTAYPRTVPVAQPQTHQQPLPIPIQPQMPIQPLPAPQRITQVTQVSSTVLPSSPTAYPPPHTTQSLPPSLVSSIHQQQLTTTSSASISAFTSHEIGYEICYKEGFAHRSFQQHYQSTRNLQALGGAIDQSIRRLTECRTTLLGAPVGPLALDAEEREQAIQLGEDTIRHRAVVFLACAAQAIEWTSSYQQPGPKYGHAQVAINQAADNLCELVQCVSELNSLVANPGFTGQTVPLVNGLCEAFTSFLSKLHPESNEKRSTFLSSASMVGECAFVLLNALNDEEDAVEDQQFYVALNEAIQFVANSTANLVLQAKSLPGLPSDSPNERVIQSATQVALYTSELIALARVLASIMAHPACQKRVQGAVERVRLAISELLEHSKQQAFSQFASTGSTENYAKMQRNALNAEMALAQLVQQVQT